MKLIAIDPGLTATAVVGFSLSTDTLPAPGIDRARAFAELADESWSVKIVPPDSKRLPMAARLGWLAEQVYAKTEIWDTRSAVVLIEVPAFAGVYARHRSRQTGRGSINASAINSLHMAIGAITASVMAYGEKVHHVKAAGIPKGKRRLLAEGFLKRSGWRTDLYPFSWGNDEHAWDAVFLAITAEL